MPKYQVKCELLLCNWVSVDWFYTSDQKALAVRSEVYAQSTQTTFI